MIVNPSDKLREVRRNLYRLSRHPLTSERSVAQCRHLLKLPDDELAAIITTAELSAPGWLESLRRSSKNEVVD